MFAIETSTIYKYFRKKNLVAEAKNLPFLISHYSFIRILSEIGVLVVTKNIKYKTKITNWNDTKRFYTKDSDFSICFYYGKIEEVSVIWNENELNDPNYIKITYTMQAIAVVSCTTTHTHMHIHRDKMTKTTWNFPAILSDDKTVKFMY